LYLKSGYSDDFLSLSYIDAARVPTSMHVVLHPDYGSSAAEHWRDFLRARLLSERLYPRSVTYAVRLRSQALLLQMSK